MQPLSPLDGRYATKVDALRAFFSEEALIRSRLFVEVSYFAALGDEEGVKELKPLGARQKKALQQMIDEFSDADAKKVKDIEKTTNHDVKAVEYFLRRELEKVAGAKVKTEFVHFALTSEDVNNLAYGALIHDALSRVLRPELQAMMAAVRSIATANRSRPMLALTHGQPATPTTLGKEMMVFVERLERQRDQLKQFKMQGKFGGAVGTYAAHRAAYPDVRWERFGERFIKSLGMTPLQATTQINPHDDLAELSHLYVRINTILLGLCRDIWMYISRGVFIQRAVKGEVGSSTMPHKINPIDFENAEGNLGLSTALFNHFAEKLPVSRLQRDLSDSTVQRNLGVAFGYHLLALKSMEKGLKKLSVDKQFLQDELRTHPEILGEAVQTIMRRRGVSDAYEKMKSLTRGKRITIAELEEFMTKQGFTDPEKKRVLGMLPKQ